MDHIVGDQKIIQSHYLLAIEDSFGSDVANLHAKKISTLSLK